MELVKCNRCYGSKKYAPMGGILVTCTPCKGTGYMNKDEFTPILHTGTSEKNPVKQSQPESQESQPIEPIEPAAMVVQDIAATLAANIDKDISQVIKEMESPANSPELTIKPISAAELLDTPIKKKPGRKPGWNKSNPAINLI